MASPVPDRPLPQPTSLNPSRRPASSFTSYLMPTDLPAANTTTSFTPYHHTGTHICPSPLLLPPIIARFVKEHDPNLFYLTRARASSYRYPVWGWVGVRIRGEVSAGEWEKVKRRVWERYAFSGYDEVHKFRILWLNDTFPTTTFAEARQLFRSWLSTTNNNPLYAGFDRNFCLALDSQSISALLDDIATTPTLPDISPRDFISSPSPTLSLTLLDRRTPDELRHPVNTQRGDPSILLAEGIHSYRGYTGQMRVCVDHVAWLWEETLGEGDPEEVIFTLARLASTRCEAGVWEVLNGSIG